jgi:hypothetical protein
VAEHGFGLDVQRRRDVLEVIGLLSDQQYERRRSPGLEPAAEQLCRARPSTEIRRRAHDPARRDLIGM